jgi:hypothetical protein
MTETMIRPQRFLSPVQKPLRGLLLDVATVTPNFSSQDTVGLYESYGCITTDSVATFPCPATFLTPPVQAASSTQTTGGTLAAGTFRAVVTAYNDRGETLKSNEISQVTTGSTSRITWNWGAVSGATGYRLYVTALNGGTGTETFLLDVGNVVTYNWTGTPAQSPTNPAPPTTSTAVVNVTKTFGTATWQDAIRFAVYAGVKCKAVAFDPQHAASELERVFNNKESIAVARNLMQQRFIASASHWAAPTDLTPAGGAVDPALGLALLEEDAGINYAGVPIIHVPRSIGSLLTKNGQVGFEGNSLLSELGTRIAADPGYGQANKTTGPFVNNGPAGTVPAAGELWIYATGDVTVAAGEAINKGADPAVGFRANESGDSNNVLLLRERPYIATVDCYAAAVRVKVQ